VITEASDIILNIKNDANQVNTAKSNTIRNPGIINARAIKTPKVVATPLPPLKFRKILNVWPKMLARPIIIHNASSEKACELLAIKSETAAAGMNPFNVSIIKTLIPAGLPNTLKALVAPTFPEPNLRISIPLKTLPNRYAVGIEPIR